MIDKITLDVSLKDIPIPSRKDYIGDLLEKTNQFVHRMQWKAFFFDKELRPNDKPEHGDLLRKVFKSRRNPLTNQHLTRFEEELYSIVKNMKFRKYPRRCSIHQQKIRKFLSASRKLRGYLYQQTKQVTFTLLILNYISL
uniref:Uncharacterized protein n=1 Tax=Octopus bimaculoides TaxID=37653 RepID=A0A0L8G9Q2_OCTBM